MHEIFKFTEDIDRRMNRVSPEIFQNSTRIQSSNPRTRQLVLLLMKFRSPTGELYLPFRLTAASV